jgi:hypothetical protein
MLLVVALFMVGTSIYEFEAAQRGIANETPFEESWMFFCYAAYGWIFLFAVEQQLPAGLTFLTANRKAFGVSLFAAVFVLCTPCHSVIIVLQCCFGSTPNLTPRLYKNSSVDFDNTEDIRA